MGRALWIAFAAIFASLLLYLAFIGHREQVVRLTSTMPDVLNSLTTLVERLSLPNKKQVLVEAVTPKPEKPSPKKIEETRQKEVERTPQLPIPQTAVSLSNVEYDTDGQLVLSGKASSVTGLDFFIDGEKVTSQSQIAKDAWTLVVPNEVTPGQHKLEVSVPVEAGQPRTIVVMTFVKAGPDEIAAIAKSTQLAESRQKPDSDKTTNTNNPPIDKTLNEPAVTAHKGSRDTVKQPKSPGFSKLAELARSQSVKRDVYPLVGLLPKIILGDGPTLVTPQVRDQKTPTNKPEIALAPQKLQTSKPTLERRNYQPDLVTPKPQTNKPVRKPQIVADVIQQEKDIPENKKTASITRKEPYTGNRKVTVATGKGLVVVQPGNTLWDLAKSIYGSSRYYQKLYQANRRNIKNPQMIFPGQIIYAPDANPPTSIEPLSPPQWLPPQ